MYDLYRPLNHSQEHVRVEQLIISTGASQSHFQVFWSNHVFEVNAVAPIGCILCMLTHPSGTKFPATRFPSNIFNTPVLTGSQLLKSV